MAGPAEAVSIRSHVGLSKSPLRGISLRLRGIGPNMATDTQTRGSSMGILDDNHSDDREQVVEMLKKAYWMEIETVMSYIANSINPDGVRAREVIDSLNQDIQEEL